MNRLLHSRTTLGLPQAVDKSEIRSALQNWQIGMMMEEEKRSPSYGAQPQRPRSIGDGKPAVIEASNPVNGTGGHKKTNGRRREPRRHTLQNGIDYNMVSWACAEGTGI